MNNLTLFMLGLVLVNIPSCLSQKCFSQSLTPSYPCCKGNTVVYTDDDGDWGVEDNKWCGIGNGPAKECFSLSLGYPCCEKCEVLYTDADGDWGVEDNKWCGIKDSCSSIEDPVEDNSDLDFAFLKLENKKENMLYSPLSIKYALTMLKEGASNNTLAEINKVLGNAKLTKYESIDKVLSLANGLFVRDSFYDYVKTEYIDTLKEKYAAEVNVDEFKDAKNVNQWIEDKTLGIIKKMLKDKIVQNPDITMLIINALAIDMEWVSQFDDRSTGGNTFYLDNGEEMEATTMYQKIFSKDLSYYIDDDINAITMDLKKYEGIQFEFMAIMPNENLSSFVENFSKEQINKIDKNLTPASDEEYGVILRIPKFKYSYDLNLKNDLMKLGIKDAFNANADFSKIADPEKQLFVSDALHKADIDFSEEGVKAAAVTVFLMGPASARPRPTYPVIININKPFMFIIRDKLTKDIWFTGTMYKPNSWVDDEATYEPIPYSYY
ncbi:Non-catalytic module family DOC2 [Piromyces sp. E2]|nr:Non-catalytic module family DOC2 [Piromyces sp. E2]|eukprot:OUM59774.1 Non-catalytic module family DOC2 [Piromyces sp. E2]